MAQERWEHARSAVAKLLNDAETTGHWRFVVWALVLQALIFRASGDTAAALDAIGRALALGEPDGYVRVFVDEGAAMAALLVEAAKRGIAPGYIRKLLAAFHERLETRDVRLEVTMPASSLKSQDPLLVEPLTPRELEVLRLLARGHDNAQIARTLVVATSTVKAHINHIFGKLGVGNRVEAVLRAQELNLLGQESPQH
jgi:LuxR family maltose regulon positive regulatory protein